MKYLKSKVGVTHVLGGMGSPDKHNYKEEKFLTTSRSILKAEVSVTDVLGEVKGAGKQNYEKREWLTTSRSI